jgi:hypothetical protein
MNSTQNLHILCLALITSASIVPRGSTVNL